METLLPAAQPKAALEPTPEEELPEWLLELRDQTSGESTEALEEPESRRPLRRWRILYGPQRRNCKSRKHDSRARWNPHQQRAPPPRPRPNRKHKNSSLNFQAGSKNLRPAQNLKPRSNRARVWRKNRPQIGSQSRPKSPYRP